MGRSDPHRIMAMMQTVASSSPGQSCVLILIFTVLLQSLCVAVTYIYFTNELKQMQDKYFQGVVACFLKEDDRFWDPTDEDSMNSPCWQGKWQLRQFVRKMILRTYEETIPTVEEKQVISSLERERRPQRVAAHITGTTRRSITFLDPDSKSEKALGQKIKSWESSRKGHSFLKNLHLRNGELVIHQTEPPTSLAWITAIPFNQSLSFCRAQSNLSQMAPVKTQVMSFLCSTKFDGFPSATSGLQSQEQRVTYHAWSPRHHQKGRLLLFFLFANE
ncbi:tumor necrosis factor ligand superfamily member 10 isoform X2 [Marmota flaviventris]|uniref:tumor necrosis factor ligand superfamily member 10 isoform X2 n=1 Tax=Marmota flaviventris TaxID=93162 RepID=UPI003A8A64A7